MIASQINASSQLWPIRYKPLPDELLSSWLVRLAHGHGVKVQTFCNHIFGSQRQIWNRDIDRLAPQWLLNELQTHTGATTDQVQQTTLKFFEGALYKKYKEAGPLPWIQLLQMYHRKRRGHGQQYCPLCLATDKIPYFRKTWRLSVKTFCSYHNCLLLDRCPKCESPISAHRIDIGKPDISEFKPLSTCYSCELDLTKAPTISTPIYDHEAFQKICEFIEKVEKFSIGIIPTLDLREVSLLHHITSMVSKDRGKYHLGQHVAKKLHVVDYSAIDHDRVLIESYSCMARHQYIQFAAWLLMSPQARLADACKAGAIRHNFLLKDLSDPPQWYEDCVNNKIKTRARPFFERRLQSISQ